MNQVVITDRMWARLLSSTNQPSFLKCKDVNEVNKEEQPPTQLLEGDNCNGIDGAKKVEQPPSQLLKGDNLKEEQESGNQVDNCNRTET